MRYFYTHLVNIETIISDLEELELEKKHKKDLAILIDTMIHHSVIDLILSSLNELDKKIFLEHLTNNPNDKKLLHFIGTKVDNIEQDISKISEHIKNELRQDIQKAKMSKGNNKSDG